MVNKIIIALLMCMVSGQLSAQIPVVINELMSKNDSTVADEVGEYDDWIELYNLFSQDVNLTGFFLSDNYVAPDKWMLPAGTIIPANGYLTIWVDKDPEQGSLHTTFKLSGGGEQLMLSNPQLEVVDSTSFGNQITDISFARVPNGSGAFQFHPPTYGTNNDGEAVIDTFVLAVPTILLPTVYLYPNPVQDQCVVSFADHSFTMNQVMVYDSNGRLLLRQETTGHTADLDVASFEEGLYFINIISNKGQKITKRFIKM